MTFLPTIWAGTLSVGLSVLVLVLGILFTTLHVGRLAHSAIGIAMALFSLMAISSGVDSIAVHDERSILVFASVAVGAASLIFLVYKLFSK